MTWPRPALPGRSSRARSTTDASPLRRAPDFSAERRLAALDRGCEEGRDGKIGGRSRIEAAALEVAVECDEVRKRRVRVGRKIFAEGCALRAQAFGDGRAEFAVD